MLELIDPIFGSLKPYNRVLLSDSGRCLECLRHNHLLQFLKIACSGGCHELAAVRELAYESRLLAATAEHEACQKPHWTEE